MSSTSAAMQDYLAEAYRLAYYQNGDPYISTSALAEVMHVSAPAVTRMVQRLKEAGYLEHEPYRGVFLTPAGEREALTNIRRHRLVEVFLVNVMQFGWHEVHDQADDLGVAVSDAVVERMERMAGFPRRCPHGEPIPTAEGRMPRVHDAPLSEAEPGSDLVISRVSHPRHGQTGLSRRTRPETGQALQADLARALQRAASASVGRRNPHDRSRTGGRPARLPPGRVRTEVILYIAVKLPNTESAVVAEAKIVRYLLDRTHPVGRSKAAFFLRFGFTLEAWKVLANVLLQHAAEHEVVKVESTEDGDRYVIEGSIQTPDGRNPFVRSIWFVEQGQRVPKFVTAYPVKKRST